MSGLHFAEDGTVSFDADLFTAEMPDGDFLPPAELNLFDELEIRRHPFRYIEGKGRDKIEAEFFPVHLYPASDDDNARLDLAGPWQTVRTPLPADEDKLVSGRPPKVDWVEQTVPGPSFMGGPESTPGKDNIKWTHVRPDEGAVLTRTFTVPKNFSGEIMRLRFDGVYPRARVYLDGKELGPIETGLTPTEFDVTPYIKKGKSHRLTVRLYRTGKYVRLDMPRWSLEFAGIHRPVYLFGLPAVCLKDLTLHGDLDKKTHKKGTLTGSVTLENNTKKAVTARVEFAMGRAEDAPTRIGKTESVSVESGANVVLPFTIDAGKVDSWSAEFPNLYDVVASLFSKGNKVETLSRRVGFRRFELTKKGPRLNGKPVKLRGVNVMMYHPTKGMAMSREDIRRDLYYIKRCNFNGIRTHFSGPAELAELCDEMGLYFVQEIPIDWSPDLIVDRETVGGAMLRIQGAVQRDRSATSILAWALGNECLVKYDADREQFLRHTFMLKTFLKRLDPRRPTMFPPPGPAGPFRGQLECLVGDIGDIHYSFKPVKEFNETGVATYYTSWEKNEESKTRQELYKHGYSGVWFSSECGITNHQPDLHEAGYLGLIDDELKRQAPNPPDAHDHDTYFRQRLRREWGFMESDPTCLGMAYFNWRDPASGEDWKWIRYGERNTWGLVDPHWNLKPSFWVMRTILAPVRVQQQVVVPKFTRKPRVPVTNLYNFTNLKDCTLYIQVCPGQGIRKGGTPAQYSTMNPDIAPGKSKKIAVELPEKMAGYFRDGERLIVRVTVCDPDGYRIVTTDCLVIPGWTGLVEAPERHKELCLMGEV